MQEIDSDENWVTIRIPRDTADHLRSDAEARHMTVEDLMALIVYTVASSDLVVAVLDD